LSTLSLLVAGPVAHLILVVVLAAAEQVGLEQDLVYLLLLELLIRLPLVLVVLVPQ
jgi:hypothetical protein